MKRNNPNVSFDLFSSEETCTVVYFIVQVLLEGSVHKCRESIQEDYCKKSRIEAVSVEVILYCRTMKDFFMSMAIAFRATKDGGLLVNVSCIAG